jgi:hypothetical protein
MNNIFPFQVVRRRGEVPGEAFDSKEDEEQIEVSKS